MNYNNKIFINGSFVEPKSRDMFNVINPASGQVVSTYINSSELDVDYAVVEAEKGFDVWRHTSTSARAEIMHRAAALVRERTQEISHAITQEMGKTIKQAKSETTGVAELLDYFAEEGLRVYGDIPKLDLSNELPFVLKEPIGVVGAITPFNYPIALLVWKLGPALITGCSLVAKPDEKSPTATMLLAKILVDAGLPGNVFNVVTGGAETGRALVSHPKVRKIAFTGSVEVGQEVGSIASRTGKRVTLELGGQCPAIIDEGADIKSVIPDFVTHAFNNAGQYCYRINRAYVLDTVYDKFIEQLISQVQKIKVGPGENEKSDMGPLTSEDIYNRTLKHISDALSKGGKILCGGKRLKGDEYDNGFFFEPTIIENANHEMLVMQEETFGPVVGIKKISSIREGIKLANDTRYGLAAYVFTGDTGKGIQIAREIEAGSVWVNKVKKAYLLCPFGGMKQSGQGREKSKYGLDEYLELKTVYLALPELE